MRALRWPRFWLGLWLLGVVAVIVLSLVRPPPSPIELPRNFDKVLHLTAYFALAAAAVQVFERARSLVVVAFCLVGLGISLEWAQGALVPEIRTADPLDALANTLGVLIGMALAWTPLARCVPWIETRLAR